jgi:DNA repair protein RecN (Recombination protein N)
VLVELRIENLLLIERAELRPRAGLNAVTGETGAGKTVLAHAFDLLLGGRPQAAIVRPGAQEAWIEGVFEPPAGLLEAPELADLRARLGEDPEEIVLARRVSAEGRTRAYVQGRSANAADLRDLGARLLAFFGQHEHRRLTVAAAQLELLDSFCGSEHLALRERVGAAHGRARAARAQLDELRGRAGARERDLDLLAFELGEIEALAPSEEDEAQLRAERGRLRQVDGLRAAAAAGGEALAPEAGEEVGAALALAEAERLAGAVAGADPQLDGLATRLAALRIEAEDLAGELRRYAETVEADPERLHDVEERLDAYERLLRKHGGTVAAVLEHAVSARAERDRLEGAEVAIEHANGELETAERERTRLTSQLSEGRRAAAPRLAERVRAELAALAMPGASFEVVLEPRDEPGPAGAERVELMLAANPGVPAAPVRESASGGELSRVMLALMAVAGAGAAGTLVFDEVDAGVGGQTARAVGERLRALADGRQVLCITHLPQIAALADAHFRVEKSGAPGGGREPERARPGDRAAGEDVARATVERLDASEGVVAELCRMLGADASDEGARRHAEELLTA